MIFVRKSWYVSQPIAGRESHDDSAENSPSYVDLISSVARPGISGATASPAIGTGHESRLGKVVNAAEIVITKPAIAAGEGGGRVVDAN